MSLVNEGIRAAEVPVCCLCGERGQLLYDALRDRLFGAPGTWSLLKCPGCGLVWLNPQPLPEDIGKLYAEYYTHGQAPSRTASVPTKVGISAKAKTSVLEAQYGYPNPYSTRFWKGFGKLGRCLPILRDLAGGFVRDLPFIPHGQLLDVGCGSGDYLAAMRDRGWQVRGIEPDPQATQVARARYDLEVTTGTLEGAALPSASMDAITVCHVIEHVPDPVALLRECARVLRPGGKLVTETPNIESLGHGKFGAHWRGLEVPRHLYLFSPRTLRAGAQKAGLKIESLRTTSRGGRLFYTSSDALKRGFQGPLENYHPGRAAVYKSWAFQASEEALRLINGKAGDALIMTATRSA